jgi:hypothetical protein
MKAHLLRTWTCAFAASLAVAACAAEGPGEGPVGSIDMNLEIAPGVEIHEVSYVVSGNDIAPIVGVIPVAAHGSTISAHIGGIPAGSGYLIELSATTVDGEIDCAGSAMFDVMAGQATSVSVQMFCGDLSNFGSVIVDGQVVFCPLISFFSVAPLQTSVGNDLLLRAEGMSRDGSDVITTWSGTGGSIADPNAAETTYTCQEVGPQVLTLAVTDPATGLDAEACGDIQLVNVNCVPGESCDDVVCDDSNPCTTDACVEEPEVSCVHEPVADGTACVINSSEGVCEAGQCVVEEFCVPGACDDSNECTIDECIEETNECVHTPDVGASCTVNGQVGTCDADAVCVPDPSAITQTIPLVCANSFTPDLSPVPFELTVSTGPISGGADFSASVTVTAALTQEFLQSAAETVCGFGILLDEVTVNLLQSTVTVVSGAAGGDVLTVLEPVPQVVNVPIAEPTVCPGNPPTVTGPLSIELSTETGTWTADAAGEVLFGIAGEIPESLTLSTPPTPTHLEVQVSVLGVAFACEPGTLDEDENIIPLDPTDLLSIPIQ